MNEALSANTAAFSSNPTAAAAESLMEPNLAVHTDHPNIEKIKTNLSMYAKFSVSPCEQSWY